MNRVRPIRLAAALAVLAVGFGAGAAAHAASFDCARARAADERAVCANRTLNDQDVRMALLYQLTQHLVPMGTRDNEKGAQYAFLASRHACGSRVACIADLYRRRIADFQSIMDRVTSHGPF